MSERQAEYKVAKRVAKPEPTHNYQLRPGTVAICRKYAKNDEAWRLVAQAAMDEIDNAKDLLKRHKITLGEIRHSIADEAGNGDSTIRLWIDLETKYADMLDELPVNIVFTYQQLRWVSPIAKQEEKKRSEVFTELVDEAISRRDRQNSEDGESILVVSEAVLKRRAHGETEQEEPTMRAWCCAVNWLAQAHKRAMVNGYAFLAPDTARAAELVASIIKRAEDMVSGNGHECEVVAEGEV